ncbi:MAG TPA: hypothetical protein VLW51_02335 [Solirubrobacteraceae bacterium]|nr:hypothetical protein [Solirubrobacteraceae bacterium]
MTAPEITTFPPAVEGSGEDAIVNAAGVHGVAQHAVCAQQAVGGQHVFVCGQHGTIRGLLLARFVPFVPLTGMGQHGTMFDRCCGQITWGALPAAPAGLSIARTHSEAARDRSDDGTIRRRIAKIRHGDYPHL